MLMPLGVLVSTFSRRSQPPRSSGRPRRVAGLFAGIGGLELGFARHGFETTLLCEIDPFADAVLAHRFPDVERVADITELDTLPDDVDIVTAGFPCQDLSQAGRTKGIGGSKSGLVSHVFRLLRERPVEWVVVENVPFMLQLERGAAMRHLVREFEDLDYRWAYRIVDTRSFGLPQRRRRVYFVASPVHNPADILFRDDAGPLPERNFDGRACGFYWTEGTRGLGWAVDAVPTLKGGSTVGIPSPPAIWQPDGSIVTPDIRDAERLQGFDVDWTIAAEGVGRASFRWRLVGNAVSVPAAAWVASTIARFDASEAESESDCADGTPIESVGDIPSDKSWPGAAFGSRNGRGVVDVSEWPIRTRRPSLDNFLRHAPKPLSARATEGFTNRLTASSLRYPVEFEEALRCHLGRVREAPPQTRRRRKKKNAKTRKRQVVSLFTGAGGLDLGLEAAGFETAVAVEFDEEAARTLRANRSWPVIDRDIHDVPSEEILRVAELERGDVDLVVGGPPCQPFSKSGYWATGDARRLNDPRATTLEAFLRVVRDVKPRAFLLENVSGLAYRNKDEGLDLLLRTIDDINRREGTSYRVAHTVLNAADYGVPQERERFFLVGHRDGQSFTFPAATHADATEAIEQAPLFALSDNLEPYHTAWDALGDLENNDDPSLRMTGKWADLLPSIPEGENYLHHTDRGGGLPLFGWRRRYWSFLLKLSRHRPSWTITAQPGSAIGPFHWKNRRLSMRELCRLQTFPDDFDVIGTRNSYHRQIGNAVPSALAECLGIELGRQFFGRRRRRKFKLLPPRRTPVLAPTEPTPVADRYLELVGDHEPHPGTGRGYGALSRTDTEGQLAQS